MYEFKNLENVSLEDITNTWNLAFSDYVVPMNMTPESVNAYFKVSGVDKSQSFGVFCKDTLVGLLINSIDMFRGKIVAYDAMTGIVPEHRGKGLFTQLFEHTRKCLMNHGIAHYYLEVIVSNENAYAIYKKKGGKVDREFSFISGKMHSDFYIDSNVMVSPLSDFPKEELSKYEPSFGNRITALHRNIDNYQVAYIKNKNIESAVIFSKQGVVPQIMYNGNADNTLLFAVLTYLSQNFEDLRISNIPITESELIGELLNIGFEILVNQYEMCIEL